MANLLELFDNVVEFQNYNGVPLAAGKLYVFALGRTRLMDTWSDVDGESLNPNPIILDDLGQCHCYVSDSFDYTIVVCDQFDNEVFSVDKYLLSKGEHSHADVAVAPSEHIGVSSYHVGEVTVYVPYLTGEVGKTYEGIDPIVVNNTLNRISANHIPLGVQDPLYFVEDSETACIIGCSAQTEIPSALSSKWDEASDAVIANSAQWAEGTEYEAGSYIDIDGHTISVTGLQPEGDYAYNSALSSKLDVTALPQDLVHSGDLTAYYPSDNPSGFITGVDLTDYATTAQLDEKLDKTDSGNFYPMTGNPSGFLTAHQSLQGYATEQWVEDKGYLTGVDIPESATWNATTQTVSANSAQWAGGTANPQIPVTGINGIKISESGDKVVFEVSADYATEDWVTGQGYITNDAITGKQDITGMTAYQPVGSYLTANALDNVSANWNEVSAKLDTTAFSDVSGTFLTAHQDISNKLDTTAFSDVSGSFLTAVPDTYLQNTDLATADGKVIAISGIPLRAGGDVPEGVMVESGLEYNAVNEISAYNGSAIAQYGAEKQFIVHDDTLVHLSNSAQYALGCNISALQRLMGIDETVLYENANGGVVNSVNTFTLNESLQNFEMIKIIDNSLAIGGTRRLTTIPVSTATRSIATNDAWFDVSYKPTSNASKYVGVNFYSANNVGTQIAANGSYIYNMEAIGKYAERNDGHLYKIIGVHRISE